MDLPFKLSKYIIFPCKCEGELSKLFVRIAPFIYKNLLFSTGLYALLMFILLFLIDSIKLLLSQYLF